MELNPPTYKDLYWFYGERKYLPFEVAWKAYTADIELEIERLRTALEGRLQVVLGLLDRFSESYQRAWTPIVGENRVKATLWDLAQLRIKISLELADGTIPTNDKAPAREAGP